MPRKTKRAKQGAQIAAKRQKVENTEIFPCQQDQLCNSSMTKPVIEKTSTAISMCSTAPVTEGTRPTYADVLSGRERPTSRKMHAPMNGKQSVLTSVEHIFSSLPKEYSTNESNPDVTHQSASHVPDLRKQFIPSCKKMHAPSTTNETCFQQRGSQSSTHQNPKLQEKKSTDLHSGHLQRCRVSKVTVPLTNRQVQKPLTNSKRMHKSKNTPNKLFSSTENSDAISDNSSVLQPKHTKKVHVKRPPPKKKVKNSKRKCRGKKNSVERNQESQKPQIMHGIEHCAKTMLENNLTTLQKAACDAEQRECQPSTVIHQQNIHASFHQGDARFSQDRRGTQCTCMALTALCHLSETSTLDQSDMDGILMAGDTLHQIQIQHLKSLYKYRSNSLTFGELPTNVMYKSHEYEIKFHKELFGMSFQNATPVSRFHVSSLRHCCLNNPRSIILSIYYIKTNLTCGLRKVNKVSLLTF